MKLTSSEALLSEAEDCKLQKIVQMLLLSRLSLQKNRSLGQRLIQRNWMLILWRTLEKDNSTIVQLLYPLLCFVSAIVQEQQL